MLKKVLSILLSISVFAGTAMTSFAENSDLLQTETVVEEMANPEEEALEQEEPEETEEEALEQEEPEETEEEALEQEEPDKTEEESLATEEESFETAVEEEEAEVTLMSTDGEEPEESTAKQCTISEARNEDDDVLVQIEGILTYTIDGFVYIQDDTAALAISKDALTDPQTGDSYTIEGTLYTEDGIRCIEPNEALCGVRGQELPVTQLTSIGQLNNGAHQGELVRLENVYLEKITADGNLYLLDKNTGEHIYVYQPMNLNGFIDEDSYLDVTAIVSSRDKAPVLRTFTENDVVFTAVPVEIYDEEGLNAMRNNMQYNYTLMADIEMTQNWVCIGDNTKMYSGIFNGNNHTISNFNVVLDQEYQFMYAGLFGAIGGLGKVMNLTIEMTPETGAVRAYDQVTTSYAGGITGYNEGVIENCTVKGGVLGKNNVGGIVGYNNGIVKNCTFEGTLTSNGTYAGGIAGYNKGTLGENLVTTITSANVTYDAGGIVGASTTDVSGAKSYGKMSGVNYIGGIIGAHHAKGRIENCISEMDVTGSGNHTGGIIGYTEYASVISGCTHSGNVFGNDYTGGIAGYIKNSSARVENCHQLGGYIESDSYTGGLIGYNLGEVKDSSVVDTNIYSTGQYVGGLIGYNNASGKSINNCYVEGKITTVYYSHNGGHSGVYAGGLIGYTYAADIEDCYFEGIITNRCDSNIGGLIGYCLSGELTLKNSYAAADIYSIGSYVGGIIGRTNSGTTRIYGCQYKGNIQASSYCGGLVGSIDSTSSVLYIDGCYVDANITGTSYIGGLIGRAADINGSNISSGKVKISESVSKGSVSGTEYVGGAVGCYASSASYPITDSYSNATVSGSSNVGGFIGLVASGSIIERNYSNGRVSSTDPVTGGGFIGVNNGTNNVLRNYYDLETSGQSDDTKGVPKNTAQMKRSQTYVDWDFDTVWEIVPEENNGYPQLRNTKDMGYTLPEKIYISNEEELIEALNKRFGVFEITENIVLTKKWKPVGTSSKPFCGVINGNGHIISNLNVDVANSSAGFIGYMKTGSINNLIVKGKVETSQSYAGGIVGYADASQITGSYFQGSVKGYSYVGGISGYCAGTNITNCGAEIYLRCENDYVGGIAGYSEYNSVIDLKKISCSYATGVIFCSSSSSGNCGALVGYSSAYLYDCYARVNSNKSLNFGAARAYRCYGLGFSVSGGTDCVTSSGHLSESFKSVDNFPASWNFSTVWAIDPEINDGFPYLRKTPPLKSAEKITEISTEEDLKLLEASNGKFRLTADIKLTDEWTPITSFNGVLDGDGHTISGLCINDSSYYIGMFRALNGATIKNITISTTGDGVVSKENDYVGIIAGEAYLTDFENCNVSGAVYGASYVGLVAGDATACNFENCVADGTVYGGNSLDGDSGLGGNYIGGFAGYLSYSDVDLCGANVTVTGGDPTNERFIGGFSGYISYSDVKNSYSTGAVNPIRGYTAGGFAGSLIYSDISGCYSHADVTNKGGYRNNEKYGGFVGTIYYGSIVNSYSAGAVTGYYSSGFAYSNVNASINNCYTVSKLTSRYNDNSSFKKSFVYSNSSGSYSNCYFDKEKVGMNTSLSGTTGLTTAQMKDMASFNGWDFDSVWAIDSQVNDGIPYLRFILPTPERVTISAESTTLYVGDTLQLSASIYPENAPDLIFWSSTDETVVTVTEKGYLTAVKEGVAKISVRAGNTFAVKTFTVLQRQSAGTISSVEEIAGQTINYTENYNDVLAILPSAVAVNLSNGSRATLPVEWTLVEGTEYTFTGTIILDGESPITNPNGLKASCNVTVLDAPSEIVSVEDIDVSVPFTTSLEDVLKLLPQVAEVTLANGKVYGLQVSWSENSDPYYRSTTEGVYTFSGELILPENGIILNSSGKKAVADVTVLEEPATERKITAIVAPKAIEVAYSTTLADVKAMLPEKVYAVFDNIESLPVSVVWSNNSSPSYESKVPGTYVFTGTITTDGNGLITNPYNLQATISVIVNESVSGGKNIYVSSETAAIGSTVDIDISFDPNSSMATGSFVVDYDPTLLSPVAYNVGEGIEMASVMVNMNYTDPADGLKKVKVSYISTEELNMGGNAVTISFKINETCSDEQNIPITVKTASIYDANENPIAFTVYPGGVTAVNVVLGDTNGDGVVNILDAFRVVRFDAGLLQFTDKQKTAADVNKDSSVNIFDAMKIQRFDIGLSDTLN